MKARGTWQLKGRGGIVVLAALGLSGATGLAYLGARGGPQLQSATPPAAHPPAAQPPAPTPPPAVSSYRDGVVAYIYNGTPVTRAQFGEYLIARFGGEKLEPFINMTIVERACAEQGITVEKGEVDADLAESMKSVPGDKRKFLDSLLRQKQMTLKEWKDDVIRPKLLMSKYCRRMVRITEEDVLQAYESAYGEKVKIQVIIWTPEEVQKNRPQDVYADICADKEKFDAEARGQFDKKLASTAGQLKPFGRHSQQNVEMEQMAFKLQEGQLTPILALVPGKDEHKFGCYVMKCLKRIPPDTTKKLEDVRADLERELLENLLKVQIQDTLQMLKKTADPQFKLDDVEGEKRLPPGPPEQVVATIHGNFPLTREQFGEYLIDRYGAERLDLFINRLIIERACKDQGITVLDSEIEEQLQQYIRQFAGGDKKVLVNNMLKPNKATLFELRHDVLWTKLMLNKFCHDRVHVTQAELRQAYDSRYGDKVRVRMIMWPKEEEGVVRRRIFPLIRDNDEEFTRLAKQQVVPELASHAGVTDVARGATGHEEVEKLAFEMKKGDISPVIALPEGVVVFRVLERVPPQKEVKLDEVRPSLEAEVIEAKLRAQVIPQVYAELRKQANPILLLKNQVTEDDLKREVVRELKDGDRSIVKPREQSAAPGGN
jgi:hypothetical protein